MPETPHTMTYAPLSDAPGAVSVYQCCSEWCYQAPQAMFHLWHEHGFTAEAAWAQVDMVRASADTRSAPRQQGPSIHTGAASSRAGAMELGQGSVAEHRRRETGDRRREPGQVSREDHTTVGQTGGKMSTMSRPTCGMLHRSFEEHCQTLAFLQPEAIPHGDIRLADRAIGHMRGQAEKVFLGVCPAFMIRPAQDWWDWALMAMEFTCEHYSLAFYRAKDHGEIWGCRTRSVREHLVGVLRYATRDGVLWHQQRAMLCGIPVDAVDVDYHRREGHGARCEPPPRSTATEHFEGGGTDGRHRI